MVNVQPYKYSSNRLDNQYQVNFPDFIGDFALGVGSVNERHVVVDIHAGGHGIRPKLNRTGAKIIGIDHLKAMQAPSTHAPGQGHRMAARDDVAGFALPIESRSVDIVFVDLALHCVSTPSLAIMEIKRILKPGGRLVITDIGKYGNTTVKDACRDQWTGFYPGDIRHWMKIAGFSNIIVNPVPTRKVCSADACADDAKQGGYLMATGTA